MYNSFEEMMMGVDYKKLHVWLDNDSVTFYIDDQQVYEDHPGVLLEDLFHFLGIPAEHV